MSIYKQVIRKFRGKRILVLGDLILDKHIRGSVSRISPEAPVPVVLQQGEPTYAPGGAANVANNLRSLGARVTLVGRIGADSEGALFLDEIRKRKISTKGILTVKNTGTIIKTRIMAQHQQVLRLDREQAENGSDQNLINKIMRFLEGKIKSLDAVIISDYGKGLISADLLSQVCSLVKTEGKIITVDPKDDHFGYYRGVTAITPNKKEAENAIRNIKITQNDRRKLALNSDRLLTHADILRAGEQLQKFLKVDALLVTLGENGMCLFEKGKKPVHIHTRAREVFDVTGAGDTVISVFTLSLTAGATKLQAADLANFAAGIVVGKMGTATVTREELLQATKKGNE
ncbi:MAG: D-glycero-beta-D-manno-heptose-7-phosphate kinase [Candidatus Omnitrophota bacterium]